jgi:hypothetical protein
VKVQFPVIVGEKVRERAKAPAAEIVPSLDIACVTHAVPEPIKRFPEVAVVEPKVAPLIAATVAATEPVPEAVTSPVKAVMPPPLPDVPQVTPVPLT